MHSSQLVKTAAAFAGWTLVAVVFALPQVRQPDEFLPELKAGLANWWAWGLVAILISLADRRLPVSEAQMGRRVLWHVPLSLVFSVGVAYVRTGFNIAFGLAPLARLSWTEMLQSLLHPMFLWTWLIYWLVLGGLLAKRYHEQYLASELRAERLERLSTQATLHSLRLQLDPHFLFNALNTISSQVENEPKLARRMIEHLGDLLRQTMETKDRLEVPLHEELAMLDHYLAIQRIRFGDRIRFENQIEDQVLFGTVPALILQPLVENAIRHGLSRRASGGTLTVSARREGDHLALQVADDGEGLRAGWRQEAGEGVGLSVTRQRITAAYPNGSGSLEIGPNPDGGTIVLIRLPFILAGASR